MLYIATSSEAKSHILAGLTPGPESRIVTTVCGLTHPENQFTHTTEDDSNLCSRCSGKVDTSSVDTSSKSTVDSKSEPVAAESDVEEAPKTTSKQEARKR